MAYDSSTSGTILEILVSACADENSIKFAARLNLQVTKDAAFKIKSVTCATTHPGY